MFRDVYRPSVDVWLRSSRHKQKHVSLIQCSHYPGVAPKTSEQSDGGLNTIVGRHSKHVTCTHETLRRREENGGATDFVAHTYGRLNAAERTVAFLSLLLLRAATQINGKLFQTLDVCLSSK